jgi:8-oxo-dGTP diphosphatase
MDKRKYILEIDGKDVTFKLVGTDNVPKFNKVTGACAIVFTGSGQIIAVRLKNRGLDLPGGHVEKHEKTPEETLSRELMEEAYITTKTPKLVEIIESDYFGEKLGDASYILVYSAFVDKILDFKLTDEMSYERVFIDSEDFINEYPGNKQLMKNLIDSAVKSS